MKKIIVLSAIFVISVCAMMSCKKSDPLLPPADTSTITATCTITMTNTPYFTGTFTPTWTATATSTPTATMTATSYIQIEAEIKKIGTTVEFIIYVIKDGAPLDGATVNVMDLDAVQSWGIPYSGNRYYQTAAAVYRQGNDYRVIVIDGADTYTAEGIAPGSITIAPDGNSASWLYEGGKDYIRVIQYSVPAMTYSAGPNPDITSPHNIPGSAYPTSGNYQVITGTENYYEGTGIFNGADIASLRLTEEVFANITK